MRLRRKPEITGLVNSDRIPSELGVNKTWLGMMHYDDKTAAARAKGLLYVGVIASHAKNNFLIWVPAFQNCRLTVPIMRTNVAMQDNSPIEFPMDWTADKRIDLPSDTKDYAITVKMFNGRQYELTTQSKAPFGLIDVERVDNSTIIFHPPDASALPQAADITWRGRHVRLVPQAEIDVFFAGL